MRKLAAFILSFCLPLMVLAQSEETDQQRRMAAQMSEYMDMAWDMTPEEGGNLNILMMKNGEPFAGVVSIHGQFQLKAAGTRSTMTAFNPNANGRYVLEETDAGTYEIVITGTGEMEGFTWSKQDVTITAGETTLITIEIP